MDMKVYRTSEELGKKELVQVDEVSRQVISMSFAKNKIFDPIY
ncbi:hypothetical protein NZD89_11550 [Alicyclobacillus fastidiosus]|uniref:Uncharacterized protein n=1 Tax=Alicyclobacillus fastidiosus TaxID=392011 RepID=A0ABY6ZM83_9BACL|nr:hypothetical protein [Alicyclobacillus fastidiosus]WAH43959.1 hypothetical protein NZD89_11550 [Alicyclobacillus fastidiosus]